MANTAQLMMLFPGVLTTAQRQLLSQASPGVKRHPELTSWLCFICHLTLLGTPRFDICRPSPYSVGTAPLQARPKHAHWAATRTAICQLQADAVSCTRLGAFELDPMTAYILTQLVVLGLHVFCRAPSCDKMQLSSTYTTLIAALGSHGKDFHCNINTI